MPNNCKRIQIPNRKIKNYAEQFKNAAKLLASQLHGTGVIIPSITNATFAIELYLKSLNAQVICSEELSYASEEISGGRISAKVNCKTHTLIKLFDLIDKDIKKQLVSSYNKSKLSSKYKQIDIILEKYNNLYLEARFSFEKSRNIDGTDLTELIELLNFFHNFINRLQVKEYIE